VTPPGLLRAGNGTAASLFEKIIKSGKERASSPPHPGAPQRGNMAATRARSCWERGAQQLAQGCRGGRVSAGDSEPTALLLSPGTDPPPSSASPICVPPAASAAAPQAPASTSLFLPWKCQRSHLGYIALSFAIPKARRMVAQRTHQTVVSRGLPTLLKSSCALLQVTRLAYGPLVLPKLSRTRGRIWFQEHQ